MKISKLSELLRHLKYGEGYNGYRVLFKDLQIEKSEVKELIAFDSSNYTRNLIERTGSYELMLMCWKEGQSSPIHGYSGQQGWIYVIEGKLSIDYYVERDSDHRMDHFRTESFKAGEFAYLNDYVGFHSLKNTSRENTISLHLHAGPVLKWKVFDPADGSYSDRTLVDQED